MVAELLSWAAAVAFVSAETKPFRCRSIFHVKVVPSATPLPLKQPFWVGSDFPVAVFSEISGSSSWSWFVRAAAPLLLYLGFPAHVAGE